jgi:hypothetical protein
MSENETVEIIQSENGFSKGEKIGVIKPCVRAMVTTSVNIIMAIRRIMIARGRRRSVVKAITMAKLSNAVVLPEWVRRYTPKSTAPITPKNMVEAAETYPRRIK